MAVDYVHRLLVWGRERPVRRFTEAARRRARYVLPGERKGLTEVIPFSFESLWKQQPQLQRFVAEPPCDPYHLRAWPRRSVGPGRSLARYQFQTRSMEMQDIVRLLSLGSPGLAFVLATLCLDDSSVTTWFARRGRTSRYAVPESRMDALLSEYAESAESSEDADGTALAEAEYRALDEALHRWNGHLAEFLSNRADRKGRRKPARRVSGACAGTSWPYAKPLEWFDRPAQRDRLNELELILLDDSRRQPELRSVLGLDEPPGGRGAAAAPGESEWAPSCRRCRHRRWETFRPAMRELLERVGEDPDRFVVFGVEGRHRFVQFCQDGNGVRGEAVGNYFLEPDEKLDRKTQRQLVAFGWNRPTKELQNYWRVCTDLDEAADLAIRTLKDAFAVTTPASLNVECQCF